MRSSRGEAVRICEKLKLSAAFLNNSYALKGDLRLLILVCLIGLAALNFPSPKGKSS
jgi:hypothetical protein